MRRGGERCGGSEAASSRGRNEAARGAAKVKRQAARQSGERCGELAAGRTVRREASGAVRAKLRSGTGHAPLPRRPSERPFPAAAPLPLTPPSPAAAALFPPHSPPHFPAAAPPPLTPPSPAAAPVRARRQEKSQIRRAAFGGAAAPRTTFGGKAAPFGRQARASGGSRTALEGRGGSLGTAGFLWARGLAQAAAGRAGRQKGTKKPLLSRIRAKIRRKILQFSPPCAILNMPRNSISKAVRYKRAFLYLFFLIALLIC